VWEGEWGVGRARPDEGEERESERESARAREREGKHMSFVWCYDML
jgi:hypothetical protein